jgi:hypothetical protein
VVGWRVSRQLASGYAAVKSRCTPPAGGQAAAGWLSPGGRLCRPGGGWMARLEGPLSRCCGAATVATPPVPPFGRLLTPRFRGMVQFEGGWPRPPGGSAGFVGGVRVDFRSGAVVLPRSPRRPGGMAGRIGGGGPFFSILGLNGAYFWNADVDFPSESSSFSSESPRGVDAGSIGAEYGWTRGRFWFSEVAS